MSFTLAEPDGTAVGRIIERPGAAGLSVKQGALLVVDANGAYAEAGADPVSIAAVAAHDYGTAGFGNPFGKAEFPPGKMSGVTIKDRTFHARYVGTLPAADGGAYGVVKDADGLWKVDFAETVATRLRLVNRLTTSPENRNRVVVKFLDANVQTI
jgi:hypothetical protein